MNPGYLSHSLGSMSLNDVLEHRVHEGVCGIVADSRGRSTAAHFDLQEVLASKGEPKALPETYSDRGLEVIRLKVDGSQADVAARSLSFMTLGFDHVKGWWRKICCRSRLTGYGGWQSKENADALRDSLEGLENSAGMRRGTILADALDFKTQHI